MNAYELNKINMILEKYQEKQKEAAEELKNAPNYDLTTIQYNTQQLNKFKAKEEALKEILNELYTMQLKIDAATAQQKRGLITQKAAAEKKQEAKQNILTIFY